MASTSTSNTNSSTTPNLTATLLPRTLPLLAPQPNRSTSTSKILSNQHNNNTSRLPPTPSISPLSLSSTPMHLTRISSRKNEALTLKLHTALDLTLTYYITMYAQTSYFGLAMQYLEGDAWNSIEDYEKEVRGTVWEGMGERVWLDGVCRKVVGREMRVLGGGWGLWVRGNEVRERGYDRRRERESNLSLEAELDRLGLNKGDRKLVRTWRTSSVYPSYQDNQEEGNHDTEKEEDEQTKWMQYWLLRFQKEGSEKRYEHDDNKGKKKKEDESAKWKQYWLLRYREVEDDLAYSLPLLQEGKEAEEAKWKQYRRLKSQEKEPVLFEDPRDLGPEVVETEMVDMTSRISTIGMHDSRGFAGSEEDAETGGGARERNDEDKSEEEKCCVC